MSGLETYCILLSENCNFACTYCYERCGKGHTAKNLTQEVADASLEYIFANSPQGITLSLFGGEPTLNPEMIDYICTRGKEMAKQQNKPFFVGMITNGSLMTERLYNILSKHLDVFTDVQLSIDGKAETQNVTRVLKDGSGSFDMVAKNIPYWKALFKNVSVHGVLSHDNMSELYENYLFFREEWGVERLWFLPAKDERYSQEDIDIYDEQLGKIKDYVMDKVRTNNSIDEVRFYQPLDKALMDMGQAPKPCGAGAGYQVITVDGGIWPCHHLYYVDDEADTKLGDVYNGIDKGRQRLWTDYDSDDMIGCEDCDHPNCFRCPAENYEHNGSPFIQITGTHCGFMLSDLKYQREIREELREMGLMQKPVGKQGGCGDSCDCAGGDDCGPTCDCRSNKASLTYAEVGEGKEPVHMDQGPCDVVQRITCDVVEGGPSQQPSDFQVSGDANENLKSMLNEVIEVLVKYHNNL